MRTPGNGDPGVPIANPTHILDIVEIITRIILCVYLCNSRNIQLLFIICYHHRLHCQVFDRKTSSFTAKKCNDNSNAYTHYYFIKNGAIFSVLRLLLSFLIFKKKPNPISFLSFLKLKVLKIWVLFFIKQYWVYSWWVTK